MFRAFIYAKACSDDPLGTVLSAIVIFATLAVSVIVKPVRGASLNTPYSSQMAASLLIGGETRCLQTVSVSWCLTRRKIPTNVVYSCGLEPCVVENGTVRGYSIILMYLAKHLASISSLPFSPNHSFNVTAVALNYAKEVYGWFTCCFLAGSRFRGTCKTEVRNLPCFTYLPCEFAWRP